MVVGSSVGSFRNALEAPEVQLAGEGHELRLLEETWKYNLPELLCVSDDEGTSVGKPCYDVIHVTSIQHLHQLRLKRRERRERESTVMYVVCGNEIRSGH